MKLQTNCKYLMRLAVLALITASISACGALHTMVKKRNLDVQTKMTDTIFLEPVGPRDRVIYVSIKNTSDKDLATKKTIISKLKANGFTITRYPKKAKFMLQANILQCGKSDLRSATDAYRAGWGGAVAGVAVARAAGARKGSTYAGAGLVGAAAGVVGDALVDDTLFSMITDVQIRERPRSGEVVTQSQRTNARQGSATRLNQSVSGGKIRWKTYRTRIVSTANKANLKFSEAQPKLEDGLIRSISGVFLQ